MPSLWFPDGRFVLPGLLFEAIQCLLLLSGVMGWTWTHNSLITHSLWGVLSTWAAQSSGRDEKLTKNSENLSENQVEMSALVLESQDIPSSQTQEDEVKENAKEAPKDASSETTPYGQVQGDSGSHSPKTESCGETNTADIREPELDREQSSSDFSYDAKIFSQAASSSCPTSANARNPDEHNNSELVGVRVSESAERELTKETSCSSDVASRNVTTRLEHRKLPSDVDNDRCVTDATVVAVIRLLG